MLGITAARGRAAVNENGQTIQGRGTVAPQNTGFPTTSPSTQLVEDKGYSELTPKLSQSKLQPA
jgi:uncharacterized membrane protein